MQGGMRWLRTLTIAAGTVMLLAGLTINGRTQGNDGIRGVVPPNSRPFGATYATWTTRWWQRVLAIPAPVNPLFDTTGVDAGIGQSGPVWFLAGGPATITVPSDKSILFPIFTALEARPKSRPIPAISKGIV
jgi:hypothetical protein